MKTTNHSQRRAVMKKRLGYIREIVKNQIATNKKSVAVQFLSCFFVSVTPFLFIYYPKIVTDMMVEKAQLKEILMMTTFLSGLVFLFSVLKEVLARVLVTYNDMLADSYYYKIASKMLRLDYKDIESHSSLELKKKAEQSVHSFAWAGWNIVNGLLSSAIKLIFLSYIIAKLNWFVVIFFMISFSLINILNMRVMHNDHQSEDEKAPFARRTDYTNSLLMDFSMGKEFRLYKAFDFILGKYHKSQSELFAVMKKQMYFNLNINLYITILQSSQMAVLYAFTMIQFSKGVISAGDCLLFIAAIDRFKIVIKDLFQFSEHLNKAAVYYETYKEYIDLSEELRATKKDDAVLSIHKAPVIEFKNVWFQYPNTDHCVLENISIKIESNEKLSIVGDNGAGKTTFIKLLLRLYEVSSGEILVDGRNIKDYDYDEYINLFSPVFQDFKLFAYTIYENICFNEEYADAEKIKKALHLGNLLETVEELPNGVNTFLFKSFVENGVDLSGGEKQRLAIARAFYKNAPVAVLDEPTAALDPLAESELYEQFNEMVNNKTAIYISHRMSSSRFCDKIAVFDAGKLVEYGTHNSLINFQGIYAEMYKKQAQYYH